MNIWKKGRVPECHLGLTKLYEFLECYHTLSLCTNCAYNTRAELVSKGQSQFKDM